MMYLTHVETAAWRRSRGGDGGGGGKSGNAARRKG